MEVIAKMESNMEKELLLRLNRPLPKLGIILTHRKAINTGNNSVFVLKDCQVCGKEVTGYSDLLQDRVTVEQDILRPLITICKNKLCLDGLNENSLIFPYVNDRGHYELMEEKILQLQYPKCYSYLKQCESTLNGNLISKKPWYCYRQSKVEDISSGQFLSNNKLDDFHFTYDCVGYFYTGNSIISLIFNEEYSENPQYIVALLNSRLFRWYLLYKQSGNPKVRIRLKDILSFPIPETIHFNTILALEKVETYIEFLDKLEKERPSCRILGYVELPTVIRKLENILNALIYEMYFKQDFQEENIMFAEYVNLYFYDIVFEDVNQTLAVIQDTYKSLLNVNNEINNNLKYMTVKMGWLLDPLLNLKI